MQPRSNTGCANIAGEMSTDASNVSKKAQRGKDDMHVVDGGNHVKKGRSGPMGSCQRFIASCIENANGQKSKKATPETARRKNLDRKCTNHAMCSNKEHGQTQTTETRKVAVTFPLSPWDCQKDP